MWDGNYAGPMYGFQAYGKAPMMLSMRVLNSAVSDLGRPSVHLLTDADPIVFRFARKASRSLAPVSSSRAPRGKNTFG